MAGLLSIKVDVSDKDIKRVKQWVTGVGTNSRDLWDQLVPIIQTRAKEEFAGGNPNNWEPLKENYIKWKVSHGYPATIGVRKGTMRDAITLHPVIVYADRYMEYKANTEMGIAEEGKDYFHWFHKKRPIFAYTKTYLGELYKDAIREWIRGGKSKR